MQINYNSIKKERYSDLGTSYVYIIECDGHRYHPNLTVPRSVTFTKEEINHILIYDKGAKNTQSKNWTVTWKRMKMDQSYTIYKINSKSIKDLNIRPETIKLPK